MARVLILSHTTGYQLRAFNDAAETLGVEIVFATDRCHRLDDPWQDRAIAVRFHELNASVDAIVDRHRLHPVDGLIAVGDRPVVLAARVADALRLPWHSVRGALASTDKRRSRRAIADAGLPSPQFAVLSASSASSASVRPPTSDLRPPASDLQPPTSDLPPPFPVVLKPLGLSGSRGVIRANDPREFVAAFDRIRALLDRPQIRSARTGLDDRILVEEYVDGREFAVEGVLTRGELQVFAIFDKPDPLEGPFFEETIYVTPSALDTALQSRVVDHVRRGAAALGLLHGPIHAECRVTAGGQVYVLEIAGRPIGGLCSKVVTLVRAKGLGPGDGAKDMTRVRAQGLGPGDGARDMTLVRAKGLGPGDGAEASLEEVLLRHAVGESIDGWAREGEAAAVMMIPVPARGIYKGVRGEDAARAVPGVTEVHVTAKVGQLHEPLPEAGSYVGFIFAKGRHARDAESAVRTAHGRLTFNVSREVAVL
jgi:biotin carboxylase